jgi:hypothetical protein
MRARNGVSPHMRDQFIWDELSLRSSSRRKGSFHQRACRRISRVRHGVIKTEVRWAATKKHAYAGARAAAGARGRYGSSRK